MSLILAIDQGTTSTRFMVFDHDGQEVGRHQLEHEQVLPWATRALDGETVSYEMQRELPKHPVPARPHRPRLRPIRKLGVAPPQ